MGEVTNLWQVSDSINKINIHLENVLSTSNIEVLVHAVINIPVISCNN